MSRRISKSPTSVIAYHLNYLFQYFHASASTDVAAKANEGQKKISIANMRRRTAASMLLWESQKGQKQQMR